MGVGGEVRKSVAEREMPHSGTRYAASEGVLERQVAAAAAALHFVWPEHLFEWASTRSPMLP